MIHLPSLNAVLNTASAVLLVSGYYFIRRKNIAAHRATMVGALATSTLFLVSYLYYHAIAGSTRFSGQGWLRPVYFSILISHTILAVAMLPLIAITLTHAVRGRFLQHRTVARWTFPIWLYVSVTGVIVYWMLYRL